MFASKRENLLIDRKLEWLKENVFGLTKGSEEHTHEEIHMLLIHTFSWKTNLGVKGVFNPMNKHAPIIVDVLFFYLYAIDIWKDSHSWVL